MDEKSYVDTSGRKIGLRAMITACTVHKALNIPRQLVYDALKSGEMRRISRGNRGYTTLEWALEWQEAASKTTS